MIHCGFCKTPIAPKVQIDHPTKKRKPSDLFTFGNTGKKKKQAKLKKSVPKPKIVPLQKTPQAERLTVIFTGEDRDIILKLTDHLEGMSLSYVIATIVQQFMEK